MLIQIRNRWAAAAVGMVFVLGAVAACDDDSATDPGPVVVDEADLLFVPRAATAPDLVTMDTSFWAVRGEDRELEIRFQGQGGPGTGKKFLEFEVEEETLLRRPDGTAFAEGDSIEIFVTIDPELFLGNFEPSGLEFNPAEPARLELTYEEAEAEFLEREGEFDLWRQEAPGQDWVLVGTVQLEDFDEIEANLLSFTRYALAVGR